MTTTTGEQRKVRVGRVVSDGMDKTVTIAVERRVKHRLYGKSVRHLTKFKAHDESNAYRVGDVVRITETRPLSKTKRWRVTELLVRQELPDIEPAVAAELNIDPTVATPTRRRGPTKAARAAAARRTAAGEPIPKTATVLKKSPTAEAEEAPVEEETPVPENVLEAETEEAPAEEETPAKEETSSKEESTEDTEEEKRS